MTQEEKDLLSKDLSARLHYGVKIDIPDLFVSTKNNIEVLNEIFRGDDGEFRCNGSGMLIKHVKPYLFPLSSMNEEQKNQLKEIWSAYMDKAIDYSISGEDELCDLCQLSATEKVIDWLIANHFDFRGLIKKGLAIDSTNLNVY